MNLSGLLDVAFFRDLEVHIHTGARKDNTTDILWLTGGWNASGATFFNVPAFDTGNRGFPPAASIANYRNQTSSAWYVQARQSWLDVVNFNYPLAWDTALRSFQSRTVQTNDFLVIRTQHQLRYLSADTAEIDFGTQVDIRVPEINLASLSDATPLYAPIHAIADTITDTLIDGLNASADLLNDQVDSLFDRVFAQTIDPITAALAASIKQAQPNLRTQPQLDAIIDPAFVAVSNAFKQAGGVAGQLNQIIDGDLARIQLAIRSLIGRVGVDATGTPLQDNLILVTPEQVSDVATDVIIGLFANDGTVSAPQYLLTRALVGAVFEAVDAATYVNLIAALGVAALDDAINSLLVSHAPTIEQVKVNLMLIHNAIGEIRQLGQLTAEMEAAFLGAAAIIDAFMLTARAEVDAALDLDRLAEWTEQELNALARNRIRNAFNASPLIAEYQRIMRGYIYELDQAMRSGMDSAMAQINRIITDLVQSFLPIQAPLQNFLGDLAGSSAVGRVDGYARIVGDALRTLRLDAEFECKLPDPFAFNGYLEINQLNSSASGSCSFTGASALSTEVKMGAENVKVGWMGTELRFNVGTKFSFDPAAATRLVGMAGAFEMTSGNVNFEAFSIRELGAAAAFGLTENYLAAKVGLVFNGDLLYGGVFFGRTCSLDPLRLVDPDVASVLPQPSPTLTGVYAYGQAFIPIINVGCLLSLSGVAGVGIFAFAEDNTVGGKMLVGASARAICAVNINGEIVLVGAKSGNDFNFLGSGRMFGEAGVKPLKVTFNKRVSLTYINRKWDYDF